MYVSALLLFLLPSLVVLAAFRNVRRRSILDTLPVSTPSSEERWCELDPSERGSCTLPFRNVRRDGRVTRRALLFLLRLTLTSTAVRWLSYPSSVLPYAKIGSSRRLVDSAGREQYLVELVANQPRTECTRLEKPPAALRYIALGA